MTTQDKFEVTKEWLEGYVNNGYTVVGIAEQLTQAGGRKCSVQTVKGLCKHFGIDLRKKPRSYFIPAGSNPEIATVTPVQTVGNIDITPETPGGIVETMIVTEEVKSEHEAFADNNISDVVVVETVTDESIIDEFINS